MAKIAKEDALNYHSEGRPGKLEVIPTNLIVHKEIYLWLIRPELHFPVWKLKKIRMMCINILQEGI